MTDPETTSPVPPVLGEDSDDTRWALETASILWAHGDRREALRWIRRAAEAAAEVGADGRAVELAKAGAELRGKLEIPRTLPPPPPTPDMEGTEPVPLVAKPPELLVTMHREADGPPASASVVGHRAVRVAVARQQAVAGQLVARPLAAGEVAPPGCTVALLVALDPDASPLPG